jgi:hypothetical protein
MRNESKKQAENINTGTEKLLLSDVICSFHRGQKVKIKNEFINEKFTKPYYIVDVIDDGNVYFGEPFLILIIEDKKYYDDNTEIHWVTDNMLCALDENCI